MVGLPFIRINSGDILQIRWDYFALRTTRKLGSKVTFPSELPFIKIFSLDPVEAKGLQHGQVIAPVQVDVVLSMGKVLIFVPRGKTKGVSLLPLQFLIINGRPASPQNDMVHCRQCFTHGWRRFALLQTLCRSTQRLADYQNCQ
jgi:hypothetical protein